MKMLKIMPKGVITEVEITFAELRKEFDGSPVEHVLPKRLMEPYNLLCDEEFLLKNKRLAINIIGSYLYQTDVHGSPIMGDIYIAKDGWTSEGYNIVGLDDKDIKVLKNFFENIKEGLKVC